MRSGRLALLTVLCLPSLVSAQVATTAPRVLEFRFTPTARAQIALWIEKPDGTFLKTALLTQAVGLRGIGNRPGATEMNSGFHWPYGRREGALPIWAHRRAAAPGAMQWKRVIFQNRTSEGYASRTFEDSTPENYFCLSFNSDTTKKNALDAVSCASGFNSDKGRFITSSDVLKGYSEPIDNGEERALDLVSLYPPRRDITRCQSTPNCVDTADTATYAEHARQVMPEIDTVTMATPAGGDNELSILFPVPTDWPDGNYVAWAEVNTEGDSNGNFTFDTPCAGPGVAAQCDADWDSWAVTYGYSYRGQPSVAFSVPITIGAAGTFQTDTPAGYGDVMGFGTQGGAMHPMDVKITNDPTRSPGSGADRFRLVSSKNYRMKVVVRGGAGPGTGGTGGSGGSGGATGAGGGSGGSEVDPCLTFSTPDVPSNVSISPVSDPKHSHEWENLRFRVPASAQPIHHYEVRVKAVGADKKVPITTDDPTTFERAQPANDKTLNSETAPLIIPVNGAAGSEVDAVFGLLAPSTAYYLGIRAVNICGVPGPYAVAGPAQTTAINFTKLSGCFVATAAYGSPLEPQVESLRRVRDAMRKESAVFAAATDLYYRSGPPAAALIARSDVARAVVRTLLGPVVQIAGAVKPPGAAPARPQAPPAH